MRRVTFDLQGVATSPGVLERATASLLNALVRINLDLMNEAAARGRPFPELYRSGVRYEREAAAPGRLDAAGKPARLEEWRTIPAVLARGSGDCEDLAAWRTAELLAAGADARVMLVRRPPIPGRRGLLHILVWAPWGQEDPSVALGMGAPS